MFKTDPADIQERLGYDMQEEQWDSEFCRSRFGVPRNVTRLQQVIRVLMNRYKTIK